MIPTPERLSSVIEALRRVRSDLQEIRRLTGEITEPLEAYFDALARITANFMHETSDALAAASYEDRKRRRKDKT